LFIDTSCSIAANYRSDSQAAPGRRAEKLRFFRLMANMSCGYAAARTKCEDGGAAAKAINTTAGKA
jgi:hypothetical protein